MTATMTHTTRPTRCTCKKEVPIGTPIEELAFFEHRGPGTQDHVCKNCRYYETAHEPEKRNGFICDSFEPMLEGHEFDLFYCGHGGWD
jgi:hypothetical protein